MSVPLVVLSVDMDLLPVKVLRTAAGGVGNLPYETMLKPLRMGSSLEAYAFNKSVSKIVSLGKMTQTPTRDRID